jgi:hypothetical protein
VQQRVRDKHDVFRSDQYVGVVTAWHVVVGVVACNWTCSDRTDRHIYYYN